MLSLKQVINSHFRRLFLIPVLTLELALLLLYFLVNNLVIEDSRKELLYERSQNVYEHLALRAQELNSRFVGVRHFSELLQRQHQEHFEHPPKVASKLSSELFGLAPNGTYIKKANNGGASVYVSQSNANDPKTRLKVAQTEYWDPLLRHVVEQSPMVMAAYFNSHDNLNRYYPFIEDVESQFAANLQLADFNFYYLADQSHNPERQVRWTPAYLDPAGQGWLVSAIVPIYKGDFLEGVTGLDITLSTMVDEIERLMLPFAGETFLVDEKGRLIAMSKGTQGLLNLRQLKGHDYQEPILEDQEGPDEFLVQKLPYSSFRETISNMFESGEHTSYAEHNTSTFLIASQPIAETGWTLFSITDSDKVLTRINELDQVTHDLGLMAILIMLLFYGAFYFVVNHSSGRLSAQITTPLRQLMLDRPKDIPSGEVERLSDIQEIHQLAVHLTNRQTTPTEPNLAPPPSLTDSQGGDGIPAPQNGHDEVTQLLNRRGLLKEGEQVIQDALKLNQPLALIQFEIAEYSQIIEHYGIQSAESLLLQCAECTQKISPEHAVIAHVSGAQFVVLLPNTSQQQSVMTARRLRSELYLAVELGNRVAISIQFAVLQAELSAYESIQQLMERAEKLLDKGRGNRQNPILTSEEVLD